MKVLITGACGLLGSHLMAWLSRGHEVVGMDRHPWWGDCPVNLWVADLTQPGVLSDAVQRIDPDGVIHCAALANVDACEQDPALAYSCNAELTRSLARAVSPKTLFVYITTDGIFKGDVPFASEERMPCPRTVYGRSKLQGEWEVQLATENHLIVRTNFYGWSSGRRQTSAEWLYHALEREKPITLFEDFFFTPIYVVDFVERLEALLEGPYRGIVHLSGGERVSKSQFGTRMAQTAGLSLVKVRYGSIRDVPLAAARPRDMSLDCSRFRRLTGLELPDCLTGLRRFLKDRGKALSARFDGVLAYSSHGRP